jgi:hypothetical protein
LVPLEDILAALKGGRPISATAPRPAAPPAPKKEEAKDWAGFIAFLKTKSVRLASLAEQGTVSLLEDGEVRLRFPPKAAMTVELLKDPERETALAGHLKDFFGRNLKTVFETAAAVPDSGGALVDDAISIFEPADVRRGK